MERIVLFDLEILNPDPTSICSIGIVELVDREVVSTYYSLIKPNNLSYDPYCFKVHKIRPQRLYKEKRFSEVYKEIKHYFENSIVVSHDIQGDMMHLRETLKQYHIPYPSTLMSCTNVLSHIVYPDLQKYNLKNLSEMIGYEYEAHHALEDAKASAKLLMHLLDEAECDTLKEFHEKYKLDFGEMKENYYRNMISPESVRAYVELPEKDGVLYHQSVCFTGKLSVPKEILEEKTKDESALYTHVVNSQTNILVVGKHDYNKVRYGKENKKIVKALELIRKGQDLKIVHENEYLELLNKKK